jgi:hypothetical protein
VSSSAFYLSYIQNCQYWGRAKDVGSNPERSCSMPLPNRVSGAPDCEILILLTFDLAWERTLNTCRYIFFVLYYIL